MIEELALFYPIDLSMCNTSYLAGLAGHVDYERVAVFLQKQMHNIGEIMRL